MTEATPSARAAAIWLALSGIALSPKVRFALSGGFFTRTPSILMHMEATLTANSSFSLTRRWLIVGTAGFGFAFDLYEMVVQAIVLRPMLMELGPFQPGTPQFNHWAGICLFVPVVIGGLSSLAGGYLTDRLGRQRVLVWSIVIYGGAAFMTGISTSLPELLFWRCLVVAGICVEFVAALAWLSELFPETYRRERVLALAQACATLGNFMIAGAYLAAVSWAEHLPAVQGGHSPWRYTLIFGVLPAIPLMIIRPFLPESLAQVTPLTFLTPAEQTALNQIRAHEYLCMFGLVEEFILPFVLDHARPQLSGDDARVQAYVCEALRFCTPTPVAVRRCVRPHIVSRGTPHGKTIGAGTLVFVGLGAAMMDHTVVDGPTEFRIDRPPQHYLHFGAGLHTCLGKHIAMTHLTAMVSALLSRPSRRCRASAGVIAGETSTPLMRRLANAASQRQSALPTMRPPRAWGCSMK